MTGSNLTTASAGRAALTDIWIVTGSDPIRSVLICDDRPRILQDLIDMLRPLPALVDIGWVTDGFALVDAVEARPADLVLMGIHRANDSGAEATSLLLGLHPATVILCSAQSTKSMFSPPPISAARVASYPGIQINRRRTTRGMPRHGYPPMQGLVQPVTVGVGPR